MQDLVTLNLTMNPKLAADTKQAETTDIQAPTPLFICPLTQREANGLIPFVAIRTSGDVFSEAGLKAVTKDATSGGLPSPPPEDGVPATATDKDKAASRVALSPTSGKPFDPTFQGAKSTEDMTPAEGAVVAQKALASDLIYINPPASLQEDLRIAIALNQAEAKASKKGKKRKSAAGGAGEDGEPSKKSRAADGTPKPVAAEPSRAQALAKAVSKDLKDAEEQRKKAGMSAAVQSLYKKKGDKEDDNYMTRGTFTRVRLVKPSSRAPKPSDDLASSAVCLSARRLARLPFLVRPALLSPPASALACCTCTISFEKYLRQWSAERRSHETPDGQRCVCARPVDRCAGRCEASVSRRLSMPAVPHPPSRNSSSSLNVASQTHAPRP